MTRNQRIIKVAIVLAENSSFWQHVFTGKEQACIRTKLSGQPRMSSNRWLVRNDRLVKVDASGDLLQPSAASIHEALFDDNAAGSPGSPATCLPWLQFYPFPLTPRVRLSGIDLNTLRIELGVQIDGQFVVIDPSSDQVIHRNCWYPIDSDQRWECVGYLSKQRITPNGPLDLGSVLRLRMDVGRDVELIDDVAISSENLIDRTGEGTQDVVGLEGHPYPYQREGIAFLQFIARSGLGCLLGDEMGLGKTLQAIALIQSERNRGCGPALVVAPATLLENWRRELAAFAPRLNVIVHQGTLRAGIPSRLEGFDVVVTSFDIVTRDEVILSHVDWHLLVLDEAQNIKNPLAQRAISSKRIPRRISIAVTGTPVENRLADLWSLTDFMLPGFLGTFEEFRRDYPDDLDAAELLGRKVAPLLLRRRVEDVADDLPPRIDIPQAVSMDDHLAAEYEQLRQEVQKGDTRANALRVFSNLRQLCADPRYPRAQPQGGNKLTPKLSRVMEILEEIFANDEKAVIFASFREHINFLTCVVERMDTNAWAAKIDGTIPIAHRQTLIDQFTAHQGIGALVLNPKAAGVGLNITAANHVIHFNPEWNPAVTDQASARVYRRRQTRPVTVHHMYYAETIEELIRERTQFKRALAAAAATGNDGDIDDATLMRALTVSPIIQLGGPIQ